MSLFNWDDYSVQLHPDGTVTKGFGVYNDPDLDVMVQVYKNWLYIRDKKTNEVIGTLYEGCFDCQGLAIQAFKGEQNGVYAYIHTWGKFDAGMVCCGVYGYYDDDQVGVSENTLHWFAEKLITLTALKVVPLPVTWAYLTATF